MEIINALRQFLAELTVLVMTLITPTPVPIPAQPILETIATSTVATVTHPSSPTPLQSTTTEKSAVIQAFELGKIVGRTEAKLDTALANVATSSVAYIPTPTPAPIPEPVQVINQPTQTIMTTTAPISQARIEIVNPIPSKGLGRQHVAAPTPEGEDNYVVLGAIVYDANGDVDKNAEVTISATDNTQNKVEKGAGDMVTIYTDGVKSQVLGYIYNYEFRTPGDHTVTFSANGMTKQVTINAK